jgi:UDP:flavonoid glycosyltransferase YjiC (YdhE family)
MNRERAIPSNVRLLGLGPQLELLRRSDVFICHGGLGSIKEAIVLNKPVIALPQSFDQPFNALRLSALEVGAHLSPESVSPFGLASLLEKVLGSTTIKARVTSLSDRFREREAEMIATHWLLERMRT